jgi:hypothetical protein
MEQDHPTTEKTVSRPYKCPYPSCGRAFSRLEHQVSSLPPFALPLSRLLHHRTVLSSTFMLFASFLYPFCLRIFFTLFVRSYLLLGASTFGLAFNTIQHDTPHLATPTITPRSTTVLLYCCTAVPPPTPLSPVTHLSFDSSYHGWSMVAPRLVPAPRHARFGYFRCLPMFTSSFSYFFLSTSCHTRYFGDRPGSSGCRYVPSL